MGHYSGQGSLKESVPSASKKYFLYNKKGSWVKMPSSSSQDIVVSYVTTKISGAIGWSWAWICKHAEDSRYKNGKHQGSW